MAQVSYITEVELLEGFDDRTVGQLASDTGTAVTLDGTSVEIKNAIERASAMVESGALRGGRYSLADLAALKTADDWSLKGLVAELTIGKLYERRPGTIPQDMKDMLRTAHEKIEALEKGDRIFNDAGAIVSGKPKVVLLSRFERQQLNMVADQPFFPPRIEQAV